MHFKISTMSEGVQNYDNSKEFDGGAAMDTSENTDSQPSDDKSSEKKKQKGTAGRDTKKRQAKNQKIHQLEQENKRLRNKAKQHESMAKTPKMMTPEQFISELHKEIRDCKEQIGVLQSSLNQKEEEIRNLRTQKEATEENRTLQADVNKLPTEVHEDQQNLQIKIQELSAKNESFRTEVEGWSTHAQHMEGEQQRLRTEMEELRTTNQSLQASVNHWTSKANDIEQLYQQKCKDMEMYIQGQQAKLEETVLKQEETNGAYFQSIEKLSNDVVLLQKENDNYKEEVQRLHAENGTKTEALYSLRNQINDLNKELKRKDDENQNYGASFEIYRNEAEKIRNDLTKKVRQLEGTIQNVEKEKARVVQEFQLKMSQAQREISSYKADIAKYAQNMKECHNTIASLEKEKKDLTLRLSKLAGANLTFNNPNIADLSDENRPTKLAEEFSELYDNEWTDAFEVVNSGDEMAKTQLMLEILKKASHLCHDTSEDHIKTVRKSFVTLHIRNELGEVVQEPVEQEQANKAEAEATSELEVSKPNTGDHKNPMKTGDGMHANLSGVFHSEEQNLEQPTTVQVQQRNEHLSETSQQQFVKKEDKEETEGLNYLAASNFASQQHEIPDTREPSENGQNVSAHEEVKLESKKDRHGIESASGDKAETLTKKEPNTENVEHQDRNNEDLGEETDGQFFDNNFGAVENGNQTTVADSDIQKKDTRFATVYSVKKETKAVQTFCHKILTAEYEKLTKEQMKTVSDIRKYFEWELTEDFQKESAEVIKKSLSEDLRKDSFVQNYIHKCLQICWSMCRHEPPVFIHFIEPGTDTPFDTNVYKPYTKTGKYVDYIVWPALYLHEGGPMLSKGVAQGRKLR